MLATSECKSTISFPVLKIATTGFLYTLTSFLPTKANVPTSPPPLDILSPCRITSSPFLTSEPGERTLSPGGTCARVSTCFSSPRSSGVELCSIVDTKRVSSTMMTASAPTGNGAPVLMRKIEFSGRCVDKGCVSDVKTLYIPGGSLDRRAYPSALVVADNGTSCGAYTSSAKICPPSLWLTGNICIGDRRILSRIKLRAFSRDIWG